LELYLDSANLEEIKRAMELGVLTGVTTNPSLVSEQGGQLRGLIEEISGFIPPYGSVSAEVMSESFREMVEEGLEIAKWGEQVAVKLPLTPDGIRACTVLSREGIMTNLTLVFSVNQALLAARAGATFVSPFVGRLDDLGGNGIELVSRITSVYEHYGLPTRVIAASIRHPQHVTEAALAGADIATIPYKVIMQMFEHPLTKNGLERFKADWAKNS
jgi:transaldolase